MNVLSETENENGRNFALSPNRTSLPIRRQSPSQYTENFKALPLEPTSTSIATTFGTSFQSAELFSFVIIYFQNKNFFD